MGKDIKTESVYQNGQIYKKETVTDKKGRETVTYYDSTGKKVDWNSIMNNSGTSVATPNNNGNNSVFGNGYSQEVTDLATNFYSSAMSQALTSGYNGNALLSTTAGFFSGILNLFGKGSSTPAPAGNFQFNLGNMDTNAMVQQILQNTQSTTAPTSATPAGTTPTETTTPSATQPTETTPAGTTAVAEDLTKFNNAWEYSSNGNEYEVKHKDGTYLYDQTTGLLKSVKKQDGSTVKYEFKKQDDVTSDESLKALSTKTFDTHQNELKTNGTKYSVSAAEENGNRTITTDNKTYTYDKEGKLISMTEKDAKKNKSTTTTFNADGSVVIATTITKPASQKASSSSSSTSSTKNSGSAKSKQPESQVPKAQDYCNTNYKGSDGWSSNGTFNSNTDSQTITFKQQKDGKVVQTVEVTAEKGQLKSITNGSTVTTFYTNSDSSLGSATVPQANLGEKFPEGEKECVDGKIKKFTANNVKSQSKTTYNLVWNFDDSGKLSSYVKTETTSKKQSNGSYGYYITTITPSADGKYYTEEKTFILYKTPPTTDAKGINNSFQYNPAWRH